MYKNGTKEFNFMKVTIKNNVSILVNIIGDIFNKLKEVESIASPMDNKIYYLSRTIKFELQKRRL